MYNLYVESLEEGKTPLKECIYHKIFCEEFNLSFRVPKKDLCDKCEEFKMITNPSDDQILKQSNHLRKQEKGRLERDADRQLVDPYTAILIFDLENVFSLPKSNVSSSFYKRKLSCYNLTAYCSLNGITYCSLWHEGMSGRSGNDLAAALTKILFRVLSDNENIQRLILWSDSCVPQNRNSIMSYALMNFLFSENSKNLTKIEQKFSEPGHGNLQEVDAVHSVIERYLKPKDIWSPVSLLKHLIRMPTYFKTKLTILQMLPDNFLNFSAASKQLYFQNIPFSKIKHIVYNKKIRRISRIELVLRKN